jgi:hypothetical protein
MPQSPAQCRKSKTAFRIILGEAHQHADVPYAARLLRARRQRPHSCRAAQCEYEFPPSEVDCHATLPAGGRCASNRENDITL